MTNADRINAIYAAFGRGDIGQIIESTSDDVDWGYDGPAENEHLAWLKVGRGRSKVMEYFKGVGEMMEFHGFSPKLVLGQGDDVLTLVDVDFTAKPTGKRCKTYEAMHFTFDKQGRISRFRVVQDTVAFFGAFTK